MASSEQSGIRSSTGPPSTAATNRFSGRAAIVTGGASGIGKATVERLSREGASVAIFDINQVAGESVSADFRSQGYDVKSYSVDVSNKEACITGVKKFSETTGGAVHYLVNCAVYFGSKGLDAESKDWSNSFAVNVVGYGNMVQACLEPMKAGKGGKSIVNIASISAHRAQPNRWTYSASKGAIVTMTKCMALDLASNEIRVNSVSPAWVWGPEVAKAAVGGREKWEPIWGPFHMPRRLCECSEVAAAICFLLSDDASFITGSDLPVDGGYMSMGPEGHGETSSFAGSQY